MIIAVQAHEYHKYAGLLDQMYRLRKRVFDEQLRWNVRTEGPYERDQYDAMQPVYLIWCNEDQDVLYGSMRLMPTTGPTLLYDVFRETFPAGVDLVAPGIWEGTRMCVDAEAIAEDLLGINAAKAISLMLLALCECALAHGIHTMISNYEPHLKRIYHRAGAAVDELGRAEGFGRHPVCCGAFEVSEYVLLRMRRTLGVDGPLFSKSRPARSVGCELQPNAA